MVPLAHYLAISIWLDSQYGHMVDIMGYQWHTPRAYGVSTWPASEHPDIPYPLNMAHMAHIYGIWQVHVCTVVSVYVQYASST